MPRLAVGVLKALSPILIRKRLSPRGYEALGNYIPGSSVAGELASVLGLGRGYDLVAKGYSVSDAFPVKRIGSGFRASIPAPPTTFRIKKIGQKVPGLFICPVNRNNVVEAQVDARDVVEKCWGEAVRFHPLGLVKQVRASPVVPLDGNRCGGCVPGEKAEIEPQYSYDSVAIDSARGSAEPEMLFTYYAMPRGALFWFTASLPDNVDIPSTELQLTIGGGRGRGFGKATLLLQEVSEDKLRNTMIKSNKCYLWSRLPLEPPRIGAPSPGWSRLRNSPRLSIPVSEPGNIVRCNITDPVKTRFIGLKPPTGHAEPIDTDTPIPPSYHYLNLIVSVLAKKISKEAA